MANPTTPLPQTEEENIEQALMTLDSSPDLTLSEEPAAMESYENLSVHLSPSLQKLEPSRRPQEETACATCPNSMWYASPAEVKCYCRLMYLNTWSTKEPNQITDCDGRFISQR